MKDFPLASGKRDRGGGRRGQRRTINQIVLEETTLEDEQLLSRLDSFDFWFNIVTP